MKDWRGLASLFLFCLVAVAFSWPLATDPGGMSVSRQFDLYSMLWLVDAAPSIDSHLNTTLSGWPLGQRLAHADSFLLLVVARAGVPGTILAPALALLGPVVSAWATERLAARHLGIPWPWSIIAGLSFGFSGLQLTALLEGHLYALLCPWLPLLAWAWAESTRPGAGMLQGVLAGLLWVMCLLTSAYTGIVATLLLMAWLPSLWTSRRRSWRSLLGAAAVALPLGLLYLLLFVSEGAGERLDVGNTRIDSQELMAVGSARLGTFAGWTLGTDFVEHSIAPILGFTVIALCLFAGPALRGRSEFRPYVLMSVGGVVLSLGPELNLLYTHSSSDLNLPWVLSPLTSVDAASFFHFPTRLAHLAHLGMGVLAAASAAHLAQRRGHIAHLLLVAVVADVLVFSGALLRTARIPLQAPSAYSAAPPGRAVLELLPQFYGDTKEKDLAHYLNNLTCSYQASHGHPLLNLCLGTRTRSGPRWYVSSWLMGSLLAGEDDERGEVLAELGIGAVTLRPDLFQAVDRERLAKGLEFSLGAPVAITRDAGEYLLLYEVPAPLVSVDPALRYEQLRARGPGSTP